MPTWLEHLCHALIGRTRSHDDLPDLRDLPTSRVDVERTYYLVDDPERRTRDDRLYVLRMGRGRVPCAADIAVHSNGRVVGYLPAAASAALAAPLARLGGAAIVNGAGPRPGTTRLRVDLPSADAMRSLREPTELAAA
ncbi:hypothetical protein SAMN05216488_0592 [Microbacterium sp. LKL04]|uniref:HIRAN domain-containing protein n=1 Tax=Microbacterium oleivorans TaxID=273677 RepID=A0A4R5YIH2_9MICO|nr:hypothetical protein [Microbacterium]TDL43177.1 hypothetical protein E2R54_08000 [Microbacterium oleivorans]SCY09528.1 hypothetical protein SAMN05216488_0592 [Microbacterium sp. LKL04]